MKGGEEVGLEVPFPAILPLLAKQPNAGCKAIGFYPSSVSLRKIGVKP
jgi:hypothetical protein